jgi:ubiquinone/menaquinone biosynthesis C-methylase UbiE
MSVTPTVHAKPHRCPWWIGWLLASPVRRLIEKPEDMVLPLIAPGGRVLEVGPGMGFFTLPMAERVGPEGRIYCVDAQPQMLSGLERRLRSRGLGERVEPRLSTTADLGVSDLAGTVDLAVFLYVLHEIEDREAAVRAAAESLRPGGRLLLIEPRGHVGPEMFHSEVGLIREAKLAPVDHSMLAPRRRHQVALFARSAV